MTFLSLIKRNLKMFFKDKGLMISSLITPMILILLYATFLKNVYVDSFNEALKQANQTIDTKYVYGFVYGWLFSSLLAVSGVTVGFCSNLLMVQDKVTGAIRDIEITPVNKTIVGLAYYFSCLITTMIIILIELIIGFIIILFKGWFLSFTDVLGIILGGFLIANFGALLSSIIHHFLKTQGQMTAVGTIVSSVYGFICGAYMPISQFGDVLQKILSFLPGTYATSIVRYHYERGVLNAMVNECHFPKEIVDNMAKNFDINMSFFGHNVSIGCSYLVLGVSLLVLLVGYVLINYKRRK